MFRGNERQGAAVTLAHHNNALALAVLIAEQAAVHAMLLVVRGLDVTAKIRAINFNFAAKLAGGILFSDEDEEALRAAGLAHVLAIAGLHMALMGGGIFWLLRRCWQRSRRWPCDTPSRSGRRRARWLPPASIW